MDAQKHQAIVYKNGEEMGRIDYDPELIAHGMYRGYDIRPDPETPQDVLEQHKLDIDIALRRLWQNTPLQTRNHTNRRPMPDDYGAVDGSTPTMKDMTMKNRQVIPNPFIQFNTPDIRDLSPAARQPTLEANNNGIGSLNAQSVLSGLSYLPLFNRKV